MSKNLILLELNEINFDLVNKYIEAGKPLPNLGGIGERNAFVSSSEKVYEHLEPWIQWVSVHTGQTYDEHGVFRLGDIAKYQGNQIFEGLENLGYSVGNLSAMNAANRMEEPAFFIPDPWTNTFSDKSFLSQALAKALSQTVNDNTGGKISIKSFLYLGLASILLISPRRYGTVAKKLFWALQKPWRKAIFLDLILVEYFLGLLKIKKPEFSTLFLNAGAHIQHHYMLSSSIIDDTKFRNPTWYVKEGADPLLEVYQQYDEILGRLINLPNTSYIIATGLSQKPVSKPVFYYRLSNHATFLDKMGIEFDSVEPRMTRDFLIRFADNHTRDKAIEKLSALTISGVALFGQLDKRPKEVFVTMDYPMEIETNTLLDENELLQTSFNLREQINFVAIKNGVHQEKGFVFIDPQFDNVEFRDGDHVAKLYDVIMSFFPNRRNSKVPE